MTFGRWRLTLGTEAVTVGDMTKTPKAKALTIRFSEDDARILDMLSERDDVSAATVVRWAIREYAERHQVVRVRVETPPREERMARVKIITPPKQEQVVRVRTWSEPAKQPKSKRTSKPKR